MMISSRFVARAAIVSLSIVSTACAVSTRASGATGPTTAPATTAPAVPGFSLTIYSEADPATFDPKDYIRDEANRPWYAQYGVPGYAVVRENRPISLEQGENTLRFSDVASGIDPTTVSFRSLTAPDAATVLEQNYEYDLVSAYKLLNKYLGKQIVVHRHSPASSGPVEDITGTLLSSDGSNLVLQDSNGNVQVLAQGPQIQGIALAKPDEGLIIKPTLVWKIHSSQGGSHLAQVTYQTDHMTWRADYNATLNANSDAVDLAAWVTIVNESGAAYPDTKLKLVAGDVQRVKPPQAEFAQLQRIQSGSGGNGGGGFAEKSFFEYHLYTLGRTTTLPNNSTKQIELFAPKLNVPVQKAYVYYGVPQSLRYSFTPDPNSDQNLGNQSNKKVDVYLLLSNSEKNGLGIPLPAGRVRAFKRDEADGSSEFIGEDVIQHTPKDENVMIKLGSAFDIVGSRRQTHFDIDLGARIINESFEIKVRNHKTEPVKVIVKENLYRWSNWEITAASDKWEKQDFRTIHFPVEVPVDGEKTVTYTVKYTW